MTNEALMHALTALALALHKAGAMQMEDFIGALRDAGSVAQPQASQQLNAYAAALTKVMAKHPLP